MRVEVNVGARGPVLRAFMACRARASFIMGPLGSGKTYAAIQRILLHMAQQEANDQGFRLSRWIAIRNTYPDLMTTTVKDFRAIFDDLGRMRLGGLEPPTFHVSAPLKDGTRIRGEVIFLALDRPDAVKKLRGTQVTAFWCNEAKELDKSIVDMADLRHGRYPSLADGGVKPTWHGIIGDTNAPDTDHWYYRLAEEETPEDWRFFRQPGGLFFRGRDDIGQEMYEPNPEAENLENLPEGYYVRGQQGKDPDWIKVNLCNEYGFVSMGRPVHPEYVDSVHATDRDLEADERYPLTLGVDFGRTPAAVITQHLEHIGRWMVLDELCTEDMSAVIFGRQLKLWLERHYSGFEMRAWGDPAGEQRGQATEDTPILMLRAAGIPIEAAPSNVPALRRAAVAMPATRICMDGRPALLVSGKARMTRKGLAGGFCYRRLAVLGTEKYTEEPDKNQYSHPVEALEYALLGGGEGREALRPPAHLRDAIRGNRQTVARM